MQETIQKWTIQIYCHLTTFTYIRCWSAAYNGPSHQDVRMCNIWLTHLHVLCRIHVMDTWNNHWGYLVIWNIILKIKYTLIPNLFTMMELNSEMKNGPNVTLMPKSILIQSVLQIQEWNHFQLQYLKMQVTQLALIQDEVSQSLLLFWARIQYYFTLKDKTQWKSAPTVVRYWPW